MKMGGVGAYPKSTCTGRIMIDLQSFRRGIQMRFTKVESEARI
jgi:hypothetical protein